MTYSTNPSSEEAYKSPLFTVEDYHRMGEAGIFDNKERVELIDGGIVVRSPITPYHNSHVDKATQFFFLHLQGKVNIRTQGSIRLDQWSEPEPDIVLLKYRQDFYCDQLPGPEDIHLIIEVAHQTLHKDRTLKLSSYARALIPEYWIVIPEEKIIEVYRRPRGDNYQEKRTYGIADSWMFRPFQLEVQGQNLLID